MTPTTKPKPNDLTAAQRKRIEDALCQMAIDGRSHAQMTAARIALETEFRALNAPSEK